MYILNTATHDPICSIKGDLEVWLQSAQGFPVKAALQKIETEALCLAAQVFLRALGAKRGLLSILLGDNALLRQLNRQYRGKDTPTDVLSWSYWEEGLDSQQEFKPAIGDIVFSVEVAGQQAVENGWSLQTELLRLLAHGCAHIAGWSHNTAAKDASMKRLESQMLRQVGLKGIYPV